MEVGIYLTKDGLSARLPFLNLKISRSFEWLSKYLYVLRDKGKKLKKNNIIRKRREVGKVVLHLVPMGLVVPSAYRSMSGKKREDKNTSCSNAKRLS